MITKDSLLKMYEEASKKDDYSWSTYQPLNVAGYEATVGQSGRICKDRADAIIKHIKENLPTDSTFVDWGCNHGYFIFELAKHGYIATGLDREKKYIDVCRFVNESSGLNPKPKFFCEDLTPLSMEQHAAKAAFCFSVLHHVKDNKIKIFDTFSKIYKNAYIEMDGANYGYDYLRVFYWDLQLVCEANDGYGKTTRRRKTWFCTNETSDAVYENIKMNNCLAGRSVFLKKPKDDSPFTVVKRESVKFSHTWVKTDLSYEASVYKKLHSPYIPKLITYEDEDEGLRKMEIEYIDKETDRGFSYMEIMEWLRSNGLFIIDINADQFVKTKSGYVLVDLESIVPTDEVDGRLRGKHSVKTYEEQVKYLGDRLK